MNDLFSMEGPEFLRFYGALWAGLLVLSGLGAWLLARAMTPAAPGRKLDLYQLAYLRGGLPAVVSTALISLLHRGSVGARRGERASSSGATRPGDAPPPKSLMEPERIAYQYVPTEAEGRQASTMSILHDARTELEAWEGRQRRWLEANGYTVQRAVITARNVITLCATAVFLGVGFIKLGVRPDGSPIGFLVFSMIVGTLLLWIVRPRAIQTRHAAAALRDVRRDPGDDEVRGRYLEGGAGDGALDPVLVGVAVFGVAALAGTALEGVQQGLSATDVTAAGASSGGCAACSSCGGCGGCGGCG